MNERFTHAVWRLTAWFTAILILLSLAFSGIVYVVAQAELHHALNAPLFMRGDNPADSSLLRAAREERLEQSNSHLLTSLGLFALTVVGVGSVASYFFARRALRPIATAAEAQSRFSSDAAHELKTPLTVMQTEIEVALRDPRSPKSLYHEILASNLDEVGRLRALTDRLLLLAHDQPLELSPTSIDDVVSLAISRVLSRATAKHIAITPDVTTANVMASAESLADALAILLDNAIKYSPADTTITLTSAIRGGLYELSIADQGGGIEADDQPYIFDRFYRADQSRTNSHVNGTGLGLPLARKLMTLQRGRVALTRSSQDGSVFMLSIPVAK